MSAQAPVGTTLAILERVLKVMSAIQARIHYTMKQEFKLLAGIIRDNTPEDYDYEPEVGMKSAKKSDYDNVDVIPVSDPNAATMSQKVVQYQAVMQLAQSAPQIYDLPYLHRQMIETLGIKNANKLVPIEDDMKPVDPVSENMAILKGKPVKAFIIQDHDAHLAVHTSMLQNPKIMQTLGQNPEGQGLIAAAQAHIMEHTAFQYRANIEKMLGAQFPPPADDMADVEPLAPEMEAQIAQLAAQASAKLLQKDQAEAQAQQAQQQQQDPLIQMQQQELQIKAQEVQRKAKKDEADTQFKQQKQQQDATLKVAEMKLREQDTKIRTAVELQKHSDSHTSQMQIEGARIGADIAHKKAIMDRPQPVTTKEPK
jgi:hypothetical protein